jgi:hypothetical protein
VAGTVGQVSAAVPPLSSSRSCKRAAGLRARHGYPTHTDHSGHVTVTIPP